jgi:hypothetical protein
MQENNDRFFPIRSRRSRRRLNRQHPMYLDGRMPAAGSDYPYLRRSPMSFFVKQQKSLANATRMAADAATAG